MKNIVVSGIIILTLLCSIPTQALENTPLVKDAYLESINKKNLKTATYIAKKHIDGELDWRALESNPYWNTFEKHIQKEATIKALIEVYSQDDLLLDIVKIEKQRQESREVVLQKKQSSLPTGNKELDSCIAGEGLCLDTTWQEDNSNEFVDQDWETRVVEWDTQDEY